MTMMRHRHERCDGDDRDGSAAAASGGHLHVNRHGEVVAVQPLPGAVGEDGEVRAAEPAAIAVCVIKNTEFQLRAQPQLRWHYNKRSGWGILLEVFV